MKTKTGHSFERPAIVLVSGLVDIKNRISLQFLFLRKSLLHHHSIAYTLDKVDATWQ